MCLCLYLFNWEVTIHVWLSFICFQVTLLSFLIETEVSFLDYIKGGYVIGNKPFLFSQFHCNSLIICICTLHMMTLSSICKELYCFLILEAVLSYIKPADSYWCKLSYGFAYNVGMGVGTKTLRLSNDLWSASENWINQKGILSILLN